MALAGLPWREIAGTEKNRAPLPLSGATARCPKGNNRPWSRCPPSTKRPLIDADEDVLPREWQR